MGGGRWCKKGKATHTHTLTHTDTGRETCTYELNIEGLLDVDLLGLGHGGVVVVHPTDANVIGKDGLDGPLQVKGGEVLDSGIGGSHLCDTGGEGGMRGGEWGEDVRD